MWINDRVIYTPKIIDVRQGKAEDATVKAVGTDGMITIIRADGTEKRVFIDECKLEKEKS